MDPVVIPEKKKIVKPVNFDVTTAKVEKAIASLENPSVGGHILTNIILEASPYNYEVISLILGALHTIDRVKNKGDDDDRENDFIRRAVELLVCNIFCL